MSGRHKPNGFANRRLPSTLPPMSAASSSSPAWHLAQVNLARAVAPLDSPQLAGFVAQIAAINALAEHSPGFVWRFVEDKASTAYARPYEDAAILFNLSVWRTPEDLKNYVYRHGHADVMRQRQQWFHHPDQPMLALWWIPAGQLPTVDEAKARLEHLRAHGPTAHAFTFRQLFPAPVN
jgi:Domain of unknown function (DUF3291)